MAKKVEKWYRKGESLGWHKSDSQTKRRRAALASRKGDALATARALQSLSNVSTDSQTAKKAASDAKHFYKLHARRKKKRK